MKHKYTSIFMKLYSLPFCFWHVNHVSNIIVVLAVHYKGMVHCDVKMANVLVQDQGGQYRGVLTDFDLSKTDNTRREEVSRNALSMSQVAGPCGTLGALTMAPEVFEGHAPDPLSDVWSFGGMVIESMFLSQAKNWQTAQHERWQNDGTPVLRHVESNFARDLLVKLLHKKKHKRITSMQAVSHPFFSADHHVLELQKQKEELAKQSHKAKKEVEKLKEEVEKVIIVVFMHFRCLGSNLLHRFIYTRRRRRHIYI
jgi:serine/threonine protein kinase